MSTLSTFRPSASPVEWIEAPSLDERNCGVSAPAPAISDDVVAEMNAWHDQHARQPDDAEIDALYVADMTRRDAAEVAFSANRHDPVVATAAVNDVFAGLLAERRSLEVAATVAAVTVARRLPQYAVSVRKSGRKYRATVTCPNGRKLLVGIYEDEASARHFAGRKVIDLKAAEQPQPPRPELVEGAA